MPPKQRHTINSDSRDR
ncbi:hypothetical protein CVT24_007232, partial [Panaeolus cyanescens]